MFAIASTEDIEYFQSSRNAFTSVLLADQFTDGFLRTLFGNFDFLNEMMSHRWHLLVPSCRKSWALNDNAPLTLDDFNHELSRDIASAYRIRRRDFPAIVFDTGEKVVVVRIPDDSAKMRVLFEYLAQWANDFWFEANKHIGGLERELTRMSLEHRVPVLKESIIKTAESPRTYVHLVTVISKLIGKL